MEYLVSNPPLFWELNIACGASGELVRAIWMSKRAWCELYVIGKAWWIFVETQVSCAKLAV